MIYHFFFSFFFNDTATTEIYTLSLHDALPISPADGERHRVPTAVGSRTAPGRGQGMPYGPRLHWGPAPGVPLRRPVPGAHRRSEEHTSELQSRQYLVCRLLLEKKKKNNKYDDY